MWVVLLREILVSFRRGTPYALLTANALVLAVLAAAVAALATSISPWVAPTIGATSSPAPTGLVPTLVTWRGAGLFLLLAAWLALLTAIVAPATGARTLTSERNSDTMEALISSGVQPLAIVVGKWLGACLQVGLVLLSAAPAFALAWLFGGVGSRVILLTVGLLAAHAALLVAVGLLAAALLRGELIPTATGAFLASLLFFATAAAFVAGLATSSTALTRIGLANPLLALLGANADLADALARALAGPGALPVQLSTSIGGRAFGAPLPVVTGALYGAVALLILPVVALVVEPYHPLKTARLRRQVART